MVNQISTFKKFCPPRSLVRPDADDQANSSDLSIETVASPS